MTTSLGGESVAGGKLKESGTTHWIFGIDATNESSFTGLPGGYRYYNAPSAGVFGGYGEFGYWWSSSEQSSSEAWMRDLTYGNGGVDRDHYLKGDGLSVRCLKD